MNNRLRRRMTITIASSVILVAVFLVKAILPASGSKTELGEIFFAQPVLVAYAQPSRITIDGADTIWETTTQPSEELTSAANEASPRILIEYADSILSNDLQKPEQLSQQAASVSPRILVEYADSILSIDLEPPIAILPVPSSSTPSPAPPTPSPQPQPPALEPGQPYVDLYGHMTDVTVGDEIIMYLSVVNPITSPGTLVVQLTLRIPSGWSITSSGFGQGAGGLRTNTYEIEQGPSQRVIDVNILANEPFEGVVEGNIDYYFSEHEETKYHNEVSLPVTASLGGTSPEAAVPTSPNGSENKGVSGTLIAIILGVLTATVGGVFARIIWRRVNIPVIERGAVPGELPLPRTGESPKPRDTGKKNDPLAPDRDPEEKDLEIKEGQRGISYARLFLPYVKGATSITIYDPYIRAPHQISNLSEFCEILEGRGVTLKIKLVTSQDDYPESQQEERLNELKKLLANDNIEFEYSFDNTLHDRRIETDTGWRIKLGRGLDIFQRRDDDSRLGFSDQTKRKCKQTIIDYRRSTTGG